MEGRQVMEFSPVVLFTDFSFIAILLLLGAILRAKIPLIQRLFIPASILAGLMGLLLGPNILNIIPFSDQLESYPAILITLIFGSIPLTGSKIEWRYMKDRVGRMWAYSQLTMIVMWGGGLLFSLFFIHTFWDDLHIGFGLILAAGFVGGHGTAAAVGETFAQHGWTEATMLAMTSATVGVLASVILGVIFIKMGSMRGHTSFLSSFDELPNELRTGLIPKERRVKKEGHTVSTISIDPLLFHLTIVLLIGLGGHYLRMLGEYFFPTISIPAFSLAFLIGLFVRFLLKWSGLFEYVQADMVNRISGSATDLLVAFGIASISLSVVFQYALPLLLLLTFGLLLAFLFFSRFSRAFFKNDWFERGIFTWGWNTGTVAMGIALLRIVDPQLKSRTLDDYGLAYIPIAPVEVLLITFAPILVMMTTPFLFIGMVFILSVLILWIAYRNNWLEQG